MTDNEIIKALECCIKPTSDCDNCQYYGYDDDLQCFDMSKRDALDLINRQKAEIERLNELTDAYYKLGLAMTAEIKELEEEKNMYHDAMHQYIDAYEENKKLKKELKKAQNKRNGG